MQRVHAVTVGFVAFRDQPIGVSRPREPREIAAENDEEPDPEREDDQRRPDGEKRVEREPEAHAARRGVAGIDRDEGKFGQARARLAHEEKDDGQALERLGLDPSDRGDRLGAVEAFAEVEEGAPEIPHRRDEIDQVDDRVPDREDRDDRPLRRVARVDRHHGEQRRIARERDPEVGFQFVFQFSEVGKDLRRVEERREDQGAADEIGEKVEEVDRRGEQEKEPDQHPLDGQFILPTVERTDRNVSHLSDPPLFFSFFPLPGKRAFRFPRPAVRYRYKSRRERNVHPGEEGLEFFAEIKIEKRKKKPVDAGDRPEEEGAPRKPGKPDLVRERDHPGSEIEMEEQDQKAQRRRNGGDPVKMILISLFLENNIGG